VLSLAELRAHLPSQSTPSVGQLAEAQRIAHLGSWELDLETRQLLWSDEHYRIFGLEPGVDPVPYDQGISFIHPDDRPRVLAVFEAAITEHTAYDLETRIVHPDGTVRWIHSRGTFVPGGAAGRMVGTALDITERKQTEVSLQERQEAGQRAVFEARAAADDATRDRDRVTRLHALTADLSRAEATDEIARLCVQHAMDATAAESAGLVLLDDDSAELELVQSAGYSDELVAFLHRIPLSVALPFTDAVRTRRPVWIEDATAYRSAYPHLAQHSLLPMQPAASLPLVTSTGAMLGALELAFGEPGVPHGAQRDLLLTMVRQCGQALDRARLYERERQARAVAEAAVSARDQFLSIAAHELKTPVTRLKLSAQLLARRDGGSTLMSAGVLKWVNGIEASADQLARLTEELLDVARLQTGRMRVELKPLDLVVLVRAIGEMYQEHLAAHSRIHRLKIEGTTSMCPVQADTDRMQQVFTNLLDNALKYSPHGGTIRLRLTRDAPGWLVQVQDQGIGLPPGSTSIIFQPFGRALNAANSHIEGMGLGLYICQQIVESHAGRLWAESAGEGCGTTFCVWLPDASRARDAAPT
jgi:PAS domain S-box-containing protein